MTLPNPQNRPPLGAGHGGGQSGGLRPPAAPLRPPGAPPVLPKPGIAGAQPPKPPPTPVEEVELEPIGLVEGGADVEKKIKAFGLVKQERQRDWKRHTNTPGTGATRMKSFHGKLSEEGMGYLDEAVNDWLDNHPEVEVKFVTSTIGTFEGKIRMPALVLNIWY